MTTPKKQVKKRKKTNGYVPKIHDQVIKFEFARLPDFVTINGHMYKKL